jgi:hypothetical protein
MPLLPKHLLYPPNENELEITVFGPGYGESIVLHVPGIGWGVIDSCEVRKHPTPLALHYLLNLLSPPYPKLAFVLLTHPHEDHYKGLDKIIREYPGGVERICRYEGDGVRELKRYLVQQRVAGNYVSPGLVNVFKTIGEAEKAGVNFRRLGEMTLVFDLKNVPIEGYGTANICLMALSPSAASCQKYVDTLFKAFPQRGKPVQPVPDEAHNLISVALLLKIGEIQVIFGSDVETGLKNNTGWNGIIFNRDCPELWTNLIKVSHHGSEDGFNPLAWQNHGKRMKPIAIITPFCHGSTLLPKKKDIENIKRVSNKVGITSSIQFGKDLYKYYPRDVVRNLSTHARSLKVIEYPEKIGFIRVRYLLDGTVKECHAELPATWQ